MKSPRIGVHVSIAGGIDQAPARAAESNCETFQCFTRSPQGGPAPKLTDELVSNFKAEMKKHNLDTFYIHAPYYINFASLKPAIYHSSIRVIREELERGTTLGARYVMLHVGSHADQTAEEGIEKVATGIKEVLKGYTGTTELLIEIAAGAGSVLGDTFEEVGEIMKQIGLSTGPKAKSDIPGFGGICFDTCHAFASGYDYRTPEATAETLKAFDTHIGLHYLKLTHVNDSKTELGGKKDRHEHIGEGFIGEQGIANILSSKPFMAIDWLLETEPEHREKDVKKLEKIRAKAL